MKTIIAAVAIFLFCGLLFLATVDLSPYLAKQKSSVTDIETPRSITDSAPAADQPIPADTIERDSPQNTITDSKPGASGAKNHLPIDTVLEEAETIATNKLHLSENTPENEVLHSVNTQSITADSTSVVPDPKSGDEINNSGQKEQSVAIVKTNEEEEISLSFPAAVEPPAMPPLPVITLDKGNFPYSILLETFDEREMAQNAINIYRDQNIDTHWVKVDLGNKGIKYRLFSGVFSTQEEAARFAASHKIAGKPVKQTTYAARINNSSSLDDLRKDYEKILTLPAVPYILATGEPQYFLYVGAFYTQAGAKAQCDDLTGTGLQCTPSARSTVIQ